MHPTLTSSNAPAAAGLLRKTALTVSVLAVAALAACNKTPDAPPPTPAPSSQAVPAPAQAPAAVQARTPVYAPAPAAAAAPAYAPPPHTVYADYQAPLEQPEPIAVPWAPPPMLAEYPPPAPSPDAYWTGGYWVWREGWAWAPGRWATPPRPRYHWVAPYYEHRQDRVVFVNGFWAAPQTQFRPPAAGMAIALAVIGAGVAAGHRPEGPQGPFLPPPPGSRPGIVVPAPVGTSPVVMMRAPAIDAPGMRVGSAGNVHVGNTSIDNRHTTVVDNVTIQAPAAAPRNVPVEHGRGEPAMSRPAAAPPPHEQPLPQAARPPEAVRPQAAMPPRAEPHEARPATPPRPEAVPRPPQVRPPEPARPQVPAAVERPRPPEAVHKPDRPHQENEHREPEKH